MLLCMLRAQLVGGLASAEPMQQVAAATTWWGSKPASCTSARPRVRSPYIAGSEPAYVQCYPYMRALQASLCVYCCSMQSSSRSAGLLSFIPQAQACADNPQQAGLRENTVRVDESGQGDGCRAAQRPPAQNILDTRPGEAGGGRPPSAGGKECSLGNSGGVAPSMKSEHQFLAVFQRSARYTSVR